MKNFILIIFGLLPLFLLVKPLKDSITNKSKLSHFYKSYKNDLVLVLFLMIGTVVRLCSIDKMPNALNVDEASAGYEAFSILKYGIDRTGRHLPVFLYSWGSGQNPLYSYILIPIIAIGGLNIYTTRLPMAIIGIFSLYAFYYLIKSIFEDKKISLIALMFFALCPWHIMKCRWALESNIFPDIILFGTLFLVLGFKEKKEIYKIIAFILFGISSYAYSTSYIFLPVYVIGVLVFELYKKEIKIKDAIKYLAIVFIVSLPIILYVYINVFDIKEMNILGITIPKLAQNRYEEASTIFQDNMFEKCVDNLLDTIRLIIVQNDGLEWNTLSTYGLFYPISSIFLFLGIYFSLKKYRGNNLNTIINIWMLAAVTVSAFCVVNTNRVNIILIPCIYYIIIGLANFVEKYKIMIPILLIIYLYLFACFMIDYSHLDFNNYSTFTNGIEEVCEYVRNIESDKVYCDYSFKEPYIYFLFYNQENTHTFSDTVEYIDENGTFDNVKGYGRYHFYLPEKVEEGNVIIVPKDKELDYSSSFKNMRTINQFSVYEY